MDDGGHLRGMDESPDDFDSDDDDDHDDDDDDDDADTVRGVWFSLLRHVYVCARSVRVCACVCVRVCGGAWVLDG